MVCTEWSGAAYDAAVQAQPKKVKRDSQAHWDSQHVKTASCHLNEDEDKTLQRLCKAAKVTRYELLRYMILVWCAAEQARWQHGN